MFKMAFSYNLFFRSIFFILLFTIMANNGKLIFDNHDLEKAQRTSAKRESIQLESLPTIRRASFSSINPIPIEFRTLSIQVTDTHHSISDIKAGKSAAAVKDLSELEWHKLTVEEVYERLGTSITRGLDKEQVNRRQQHGKNVLSPPPRHFFRKIFGYFFEGFGTLLIVAAIICFIAWEPLGFPDPQVSNLALAFVLILVILLQAFFNAWQDWTTSRTMNSILSMLPTETLVLRDGIKTKLPAAELVQGDIVYLTLGSKLPADLRLIETSPDLAFDRSTLTGESDPVRATVDCTDENLLETMNICLMGTYTVAGSGVGIVVQIGDNTVFGRIAKLSSGERIGRTTLQKEILRFVIMIATVATVTGTIVVVVWATWLHRDYPDYLSASAVIVNVISVIVAFVPDGLPVAVTLALTIIANAMKRKKILCKSLTTVESLGSISVLCSDKTGTLTCNRMFAQNALVGHREFSISQTHDSVALNDENALAIKQLQMVSALCNGASFDQSTMDLPVNERRINGDATDTAILRFAETISEVQPKIKNYDKVYDIPFNSKNKWMLRLLKPRTRIAALECLSSQEEYRDGDFIMFVKGAPDVLMRRCTRALLPDGTIVSLSDELKRSIVTIQEGWSARGQRVLLFARRLISMNLIDKEDIKSFSFTDYVVNNLNQELVIVGMVGIVDPPRDDIPEVVRICRGAGIRFMMVTGDFKLTAAAIANQIGIFSCAIDKVDTIQNLSPTANKVTVAKYKPQYQNNDRQITSLLLTGADIITLNDAMWEQVCAYDEIVFARTTPEQKLRIVKEFQARGNIVGMTGDGVNDAPSLKAADVGIAMGSGSDVAMEAADMILLEDFSSIITAIEYGRLVYDNLKKVILYLIPAGSWSELWPVIANTFFGVPQTLSPIQMILICVITDVGPALSLVMEKPETDLLKRPPRNPKTDRLADWKLLLQAYGFIGMIEMILSMIVSFWHFSRRGIPLKDLWLGFAGYKDVDQAFFTTVLYEAQTVYFVNLVIMQWFNLLATRTRRLSVFQHLPLFNKSTQNPYLFIAMMVSLSFALFFIYVPAFHTLFLTAIIPAEYYFIPMAFGIGLLTLEEIRKYIVRIRPKGFHAKIAW